MKRDNGDLLDPFPISSQSFLGNEHKGIDGLLRGAGKRWMCAWGTQGAVIK